MTETRIKTLIGLALSGALLSPLPASAVSIPSKDAIRHIGETVSVTGRARLTFMRSGEVYIDLDGQGENAPFAGYVSRWNRITFQNLPALDGKMVRITGQVATFRDQPQIFLRDASQISVKNGPAD